MVSCYFLMAILYLQKIHAKLLTKKKKLGVITKKTVLNSPDIFNRQNKRVSLSIYFQIATLTINFKIEFFNKTYDKSNDYVTGISNDESF